MSTSCVVETVEYREVVEMETNCVVVLLSIEEEGTEVDEETIFVEVGL